MTTIDQVAAQLAQLHTCPQCDGEGILPAITADGQLTNRPCGICDWNPVRGIHTVPHPIMLAWITREARQEKAAQRALEDLETDQ